MLRVHTDVFMKAYWYSINSITTMVVTEGYEYSKYCEEGSVMNQAEGALTGNYLVRMKVLRMTQLSHEVCISNGTNSC